MAGNGLIIRGRMGRATGYSDGILASRHRRHEVARRAVRTAARQGKGTSVAPGKET
jgi:hypothetical protein